jgi:hypothetical protein
LRPEYEDVIILGIDHKTSELYEKKKRDQAQEAMRMQKGTHRKQDIFKRNPKKAKK